MEAERQEAEQEGEVAIWDLRLGLGLGLGLGRSGYLGPKVRDRMLETEPSSKLVS